MCTNTCTPWQFLKHMCIQRAYHRRDDLALYISHILVCHVHATLKVFLMYSCAHTRVHNRQRKRLVRWSRLIPGDSPSLCSNEQCLLPNCVYMYEVTLFCLFLDCFLTSSYCLAAWHITLIGVPRERENKLYIPESHESITLFLDWSLYYCSSS